MSEWPSAPISPRWSSTTKLVVALTFAAFILLMIISFRNMVGPILLSFVLSYLLYPVADRLRRWIHLPWRLSVLIVFVLLLMILIGLLTWGGITLAGQIQNLVNFLQNTLTNLPTYLDQWNRTPLMIGPFKVDLGQLDLNTLGDQILNTVRPILSQAGSLLTSFATGAASMIGWLLFVLLVSFFILSETEGEPERLIDISIPGYSDDFKRLGNELGRIWNAFMRGQLIIFAITVVVYNVLLGSLGVHYFFGLALLAGLARFVPYVGPWVTWITYGLVCYFQGTTVFGLSPLAYTFVVIGIAILMDNFLDSFVMPQLMADALQVHPAAVMVAALVAASLLGLIGVVLAAPVLATMKLVANYVTRKLLDVDPWANARPPSPKRPMPKPVIWLQKAMQGLWQIIKARLKRK